MAKRIVYGTEWIHDQDRRTMPAWLSARLHDDGKVPSILEAAKRHRQQAEDDLETMKCGECCGRCSSSGLCGSSSSWYLRVEYGSDACPFSDEALMRQVLDPKDWHLILQALEEAKRGNG